MTPLAQMIARDMARPERERRFRGAAEGWVTKHLFEAQFFEVSAVFGMARAVVQAADFTVEALRDLAFLPADLTWLEWKFPADKRGALMLAEIGPDEAFAMMVSERDFFAAPIGILPMHGELMRTDEWPKIHLVPGAPRLRENAVGCLAWDTYGLLQIVNQPRGVLRREHAAHRGFARELSRCEATKGRPLPGHTEILLKAGDPGERREREDAADSATERAERRYHHVRSHLRRVHGKWTRIPGFWRGDLALGIKLSSYRMVQPATEETKR